MSDETLNIIISAVIVPTLVALVPLLIAFINHKTNELKQRCNSEKLRKYTEIAEDAVKTSVASVYQTFVDTLKKRGEFDEKAQKIAFNEAKTRAVIIMGEAAKEALQQAYGSFDTWLDNKIEYYVKIGKV